MAYFCISFIEEIHHTRKRGHNKHQCLPVYDIDWQPYDSLVTDSISSGRKITCAYKLHIISSSHSHKKAATALKPAVIKKTEK